MASVKEPKKFKKEVRGLPSSRRQTQENVKKQWKNEGTSLHSSQSHTVNREFIVQGTEP